MKRVFLLACVLLSTLTVGTICFAQTKQSVDFGKLDFYDNFASEIFRPCNVMVWTPDDYSADKKYAVLYMHDGQMLFDATTSWNKQSWNVDSVASALMRENSVRDFIVVGIDNHPTRRLYEYIPSKVLDYLPADDALLQKYNKAEFNSDEYLAFIVKELKPFIDKTYSTLSDKENTLIMGSSCGGLISLYAICEYPDVFGTACCLSTHVAMIPDGTLDAAPIWAKSLRDYLEEKLPAANSCRIYMDYGDQTVDQLYLPYQPLVDEIFHRQGWDDLHFKCCFFPGESHSEECWQKRMNIPIKFAIGI